MVEKNCSCQPKKLMVALAQGVAPSQYGRRGGWTGMDLAQLQTRLGQLGVRPKDEYRAALYIDHLADAQTYFQTTLAGPVGAVPPGLGDGYSFVAAALRSASLLQELADILDFYV